MQAPNLANTLQNTTLGNYLTVFNPPTSCRALHCLASESHSLALPSRPLYTANV